MISDYDSVWGYRTLARVENDCLDKKVENSTLIKVAEILGGFTYYVISGVSFILTNSYKKQDEEAF